MSVIMGIDGRPGTGLLDDMGRFRFSWGYKVIFSDEDGGGGGRRPTAPNFPLATELIRVWDRIDNIVWTTL